MSHLVDGANEWTAPRTKLEGLSVLDHLFNRLDGMYPGKWRTYFPSEQSIQNWKDECARVFAEEGIRPAQLDVGLRECRRQYREWPPSVPQLADACNPPVDPVAAYHEALAGLEARGKGEHGAWSHPAIYWAASSLRAELRSQPGQFMRDRWAAALKAQLARGTWELIPAPRPQLAAPGKSETSKEAAAAELAKLGALGIFKTANSKIDGRGWARKIMDRFARGDKSLKPLQIKEARVALGINMENEEGGDGE
ncbi:replication protein P [Duganella sp. BJB475]|uniref:replication protein P n=1 Tax=Duganella sp. BJB475 TaxID=2233914 RepID=UPI000E345C2C|nr:replication protein P [Duganella sp. BJB475]RFP19173.1 hypothetical protein D0T23_05165 [Duganella sp. BJB475]